MVGTKASAIPLDCGRGARLQPDVAGKAPGLVGGVARPVVGEPFDGLGQLVHAPKAMLDGGDHEIADIFALDALGGGDMAHGFTVTAVEREGDTDLLAIIAADLEAVRAPAQIRAVHRDPAVVTAFSASRMTLEQEIVQLHHPM